MSEFLNMYSLKNLVSQKTCFKNPENPSCIDLILTNCSRSFQNTGVFETGLPDFHKLTFTVLKQYYLKQKPKVVFYRKYKNFRNDLFRSELENELSNYDTNNIEYDIFLRTFLKILDKYAPMKKKYLKTNHATFMTKEVGKTIMIRSKWRNKFLQDKNEQWRSDYQKQRNLCFALVCMAKQQYFSVVISGPTWRTRYESQGKKTLPFPYTLFWIHFIAKKRHHRNRVYFYCEINMKYARRIHLSLLI